MHLPGAPRSLAAAGLFAATAACACALAAALGARRSYGAPAAVAAGAVVGASREAARAACPVAPVVDGQSLSSLIEESSGLLIVGMPNMRCTLAARGAAESRGVPYAFHEFGGPFLYEPGASAVWDYLHCMYPDDQVAGGTIMHSYVFDGGAYVGQGFKAAEKLSSGALGAAAGSAAEGRGLVR